MKMPLSNEEISRVVIHHTRSLITGNIEQLLV